MSAFVLIALYASISFSITGVTDDEPATTILPFGFVEVNAPLFATSMYLFAEMIFCPSSLMM